MGCKCEERKRPDVVTSHQAQADQERRAQQDAEANTRAMQQSAANAVANAGGWYLTPQE